MNKSFLVAFLLGLSLAPGAHSQSTSSAWRDVVADYGATNSCTTNVDSGPAINNAIAAVPSGTNSVVVFFPAGCYLIKTQIVDTNNQAYITYLGLGNVELRASSSNPPSNSIIQFGNDSTTVALRKIENLLFNCNGQSIDGIDVDGLNDSEFDAVSILYCAGTAHLRTIGNNQSNANLYKGGVIEGSSGNGVLIGTQTATGSPSQNSWTFLGTKILFNGSTSTGVGLDFEGTAGAFLGGTVGGGSSAGWSTAIAIGDNNDQSNQDEVVGSVEISGSYIENFGSYGIRLGAAGKSGYKSFGANIVGNYINCNSWSSTTGVEIEQASGFSITGNDINGCTTAPVYGYADGTNQGADHGFVGANYIAGSTSINLQGSSNTTTTSVSTKSAAYTLNGADSWVNVTGNTTITVPHAISSTRWDVFNSGSGTVSLVCDSGTINGGSSVTVAADSGKTVITDGTNCFAH
jgi:hypothetical protein